MRPDLLYQISQRPDLRIQPQDRLKIVISSKEPELTAPFNMGAGGYQVGQDGEIRRTTTSSILDGGFLVDKQGNIDFPTLGTLRVEGLTKQDLAYQIRNRLREERYISDAMVTVDILNFKINVIGEVRSPGILNVVDEKITLFEAVTRAGGVTSNAEMGEIRVIREDRRGYRLFINDLRTVGVLESPTFYLQQNDIVYVLPRTATMTERENRTWQWINTVLGFGGILISVLILYNYYR
jgi:polysaccharide export outer membrane protein